VKTIVSSKGQIVLPAEFRHLQGAQRGQEFDAERLDRGDCRLVRRAAPPNQGAIDWLLSCPQKGFFVPVDSESTDEPGDQTGADLRRIEWFRHA
jgi:bifunctional DNA-binding transcriptional regulator/antitoxin component of YhaV-PrlF toxin-antitoxin module